MGENLLFLYHAFVCRQFTAAKFRTDFNKIRHKTKLCKPKKNNSVDLVTRHRDAGMTNKWLNSDWIRDYSPLVCLKTDLASPSLLSNELNRLKRQTDHSESSNVQVKNAWIYTATTPRVFMAWCTETTLLFFVVTFSVSHIWFRESKPFCFF
jgi:hypothetical protein